MEFENAQIEELKKKDKENEDKIKELEDKLLYQEVYNRRENLRSFEIPESTTGAKNTFQMMRTFLKKSWMCKMQRILTFSVRPCSSVGRVTVDLIRRSRVQFPPRPKDFFFTSCGFLIPFTRANAKLILTVNRKSHYPIETLVIVFWCSARLATVHN